MIRASLGTGARGFKSRRSDQSINDLAFCGDRGLQTFCKTSCRGVLEFEDCGVGNRLGPREVLFQNPRCRLQRVTRNRNDFRHGTSGFRKQHDRRSAKAVEMASVAFEVRIAARFIEVIVPVESGGFHVCVRAPLLAELFVVLRGDPRTGACFNCKHGRPVGSGCWPSRGPLIARRLIRALGSFGGDYIRPAACRAGASSNKRYPPAIPSAMLRNE